MKINKENLNIKIVWLVALALLGLQSVLERFAGLVLFMGGIDSKIVKSILIVILVVAPIFILRAKKNKALKLVYGIFVFIMVATIFISVMFSQKDKYYYLQSPDGKRTLVVEEASVLSYGQSNFYEKKHGVFIKSLNRVITTEEGYRPFSNNKYKVTWKEDNTVEIEYASGENNVWKTEIIKLK